MSGVSRVALFTDGLFPDVIGGMQKHSFFLAEYLARNGVEVDLYYTASSEKKRTAFEQFSPAARERIHAVFVPFPSMGFLPGHYIKESYAYSEAVYKTMQKKAPADLIYAQGFTGWHAAKMKSTGKLDIPLFVNLHGLEMFQKSFGVRAKMEQYLLRAPAEYILKHADFAYSLGGKLNEILEARIPKDKIIKQSIGIDASWLIAKEAVKSVSSKPRKFIFIGRDEKRKGLDLLNSVMQSSDASTCEFHMVGPFNRKDQVKAQHIIYYGMVQGEDQMRQLLDGCEVLICPSYAEGMPTVIIEAMSRGLAVIATDVGAVSELVGDQTGWLIEPGNKDQLSFSIQDAVNGKQLPEKQSAARLLIEHKFTWERVVADTLSEFVNVLKNK